MNKERSQGIIIRSWLPAKQMVVCLDRDRGKTRCLLTKPVATVLACQGILLQYTLQQRNDIFFMVDIEALALPAPWVRDDIFFLHHILELCMVYAPYNHEAYELFMLLSLLYQNHTPATMAFFKKSVLCKVVTLLGLYPDPLVQQGGDGEHERKIDQWLLRALELSEGEAYLKTFSSIKQWACDVEKR
jgi:hypothetical protein